MPKFNSTSFYDNWFRQISSLRFCDAHYCPICLSESQRNPTIVTISTRLSPKTFPSRFACVRHINVHHGQVQDPTSSRAEAILQHWHEHKDTKAAKTEGATPIQGNGGRDDTVPIATARLLNQGVDEKVVCAAAGYVDHSERNISALRQGSCRDHEARLARLRALELSISQMSESDDLLAADVPIPTIVEHLILRKLSKNIICAAADYTRFCDETFARLAAGQVKQAQLRRESLLKLANLRVLAPNRANPPERDARGHHQMSEDATLPELTDALQRAGASVPIICAAAGFGGVSERNVERLRQGSVGNQDGRRGGLLSLRRALSTPAADGYCLDNAPLRLVVGELEWRGFAKSVICAAAAYTEFTDDYVEQLYDGRCNKKKMRTAALLELARLVPDSLAKDARKEEEVEACHSIDALVVLDVDSLDEATRETSVMDAVRRLHADQFMCAARTDVGIEVVVFSDIGLSETLMDFLKRHGLRIRPPNMTCTNLLVSISDLKAPCVVITRDREVDRLLLLNRSLGQQAFYPVACSISKPSHAAGSISCVTVYWDVENMRPRRFSVSVRHFVLRFMSWLEQNVLIGGASSSRLVVKAFLAKQAVTRGNDADIEQALRNCGLKVYVAADTKPQAADMLMMEQIRADLGNDWSSTGREAVCIISSDTDFCHLKTELLLHRRRVAIVYDALAGSDHESVLTRATSWSIRTFDLLSDSAGTDSDCQSGNCGHLSDDQISRGIVTKVRLLWNFDAVDPAKFQRTAIQVLTSVIVQMERTTGTPVVIGELVLTSQTALGRNWTSSAMFQHLEAMCCAVRRSVRPEFPQYYHDWVLDQPVGVGQQGVSALFWIGGGVSFPLSTIIGPAVLYFSGMGAILISRFVANAGLKKVLRGGGGVVPELCPAQTPCQNPLTCEKLHLKSHVTVEFVPVAIDKLLPNNGLQWLLLHPWSSGEYCTNCSPHDASLCQEIHLMVEVT